jgi:hypothetical protein
MFPNGGYGGPYWGGGSPWFTPGPYFGGYPYDYTDFYDYNANMILEDDEIKDLVSDNIAADPYIPQSDVDNVKVDVKDGVVHLAGSVRNKRSKPLAYADAFWSRGVVDVESDLQVEQRAAPQRRGERQMQGQTMERRKGGRGGKGR